MSLLCYNIFKEKNMDGIIKSLNSYSLTQEKFEEMNNASKKL